jgi:hypothetical protein
MTHHIGYVPVSCLEPVDDAIAETAAAVAKPVPGPAAEHVASGETGLNAETLAVLAEAAALLPLADDAEAGAGHAPESAAAALVPAAALDDARQRAPAYLAPVDALTPVAAAAEPPPPARPAVRVSLAGQLGAAV